MRKLQVFNSVDTESPFKEVQLFCKRNHISKWVIPVTLLANLSLFESFSSRSTDFIFEIGSSRRNENCSIYLLSEINLTQE